MTGFFTPGRVTHGSLYLGYKSSEFSDLYSRDLVVRTACRTSEKPKHSRRHKIHESREIFFDSRTRDHYWKVSRNCGCGWSKVFIERRLYDTEFHSFIVHGTMASHPLEGCPDLPRTKERLQRKANYCK